mgnify:FL=1
MAWLARPELPARTNIVADNDQFNATVTDVYTNASSSDGVVKEDLVWCNNPGPESRFNIAFFVSCVTFSITSCGLLIILRSKELRRMIGGRFNVNS